MIFMSEKEYRQFADEYAGYCTKCKTVTNECGVEPDAEHYECDECGKHKVMGIENAFMYGYIQLKEDEPES